MTKKVNTQKNYENLASTVLGKIKDGDVTMRPKSYFILRSALMIFGSLFVLLMTIYLTSLITLIVNENDITTLSTLGLPGIMMLIRVFPWVLILLAIILVGVLEVLNRQFSLVYKRPLIYSGVGIVLVVVVGGTLLAQTSMHSYIFNLGAQYRVPFAQNIYGDYIRRERPGMHRGVIERLQEHELLIKTRTNGQKKVVLTEETRRPQGGELVVGMRVLIMGEELEGVIKAHGIRPIESPRGFRGNR